MFTVCYYLSYKNALNQFNGNAVERNNELILSLENNGLLQNNEQQSSDNTGTDLVNSETADTIHDTSVPADTVAEVIIMPTTKYTLQTYDIKSGIMEEESLSTPSYLVGLNREEVIEYLYDYMQDLTWNEFEKGLASFELTVFSKQNVVLRKTYNIDIVEDKYFLKSQNGYIVVYFSDQKTVFDYTSVSVEPLSQFEKLQLEKGIIVKDLEELYAVLENYSS